MLKQHAWLWRGVDLVICHPTPLLHLEEGVCAFRFSVIRLQVPRQDGCVAPKRYFSGSDTRGWSVFGVFCSKPESWSSVRHRVCHTHTHAHTHTHTHTLHITHPTQRHLPCARARTHTYTLYLTHPPQRNTAHTHTHGARARMHTPQEMECTITSHLTQENRFCLVYPAISKLLKSGLGWG